MRIVVTTSGTTPEAEVDPRFGRAAAFLLYDTDTDTWEAHPNAQNLQAAQGAGIQAGQAVANLGADWVLTGHCGPKAFRVLSAAGIRVGVGVHGTAREIVASLLDGRIEPATAPDVEGHW